MRAVGTDDVDSQRRQRMAELGDALTTFAVVHPEDAVLVATERNRLAVRLQVGPRDAEVVKRPFRDNVPRPRFGPMTTALSAAPTCQPAPSVEGTPPAISPPGGPPSHAAPSARQHHRSNLRGSPRLSRDTPKRLCRRHKATHQCA